MNILFPINGLGMNVISSLMGGSDASKFNAAGTREMQALESLRSVENIIQSNRRRRGGEVFDGQLRILPNGPESVDVDDRGRYKDYKQLFVAFTNQGNPAGYKDVFMRATNYLRTLVNDHYRQLSVEHQQQIRAALVEARGHLEAAVALRQEDNNRWGTGSEAHASHAVMQNNMNEVAQEVDAIINRYCIGHTEI